MLKTDGSGQRIADCRPGEGVGESEGERQGCAVSGFRECTPLAYRLHRVAPALSLSLYGLERKCVHRIHLVLNMLGMRLRDARECQLRVCMCTIALDRTHSLRIIDTVHLFRSKVGSGASCWCELRCYTRQYTVSWLLVR